MRSTTSLIAVIIGDLIWGIAKETINERIRTIKRSLRFIAISLVLSSTAIFFLSIVGIKPIISSLDLSSELSSAVVSFIQSISIELLGAGAIILIVELSLKEADQAEMEALQSKMENVQRSLEDTNSILREVSSHLLEQTYKLGEQVNALSELLEKQSKN